jgi:hypothetical protein
MNNGFQRNFLLCGRLAVLLWLDCPGLWLQLVGRAYLARAVLRIGRLVCDQPQEVWEEVGRTPESLLPAQRVTVQVGILPVMSSTSVVLRVLRRFAVGVCGFGFDVLV